MDSWRKELKPDIKPVRCSVCGGTLTYKSHGAYVCEECGNMEYDDFGKIRAYIDENGPTPAAVISAATGVPIQKINNYLREGRVEIPEGSNIYIKCENCGQDIRFGRYCPECAAKLSKNLSGVFEAGEIPKKSSAKTGRMRFISRDK
ncbi:MAG: hypothetical protein ACI4EW_04350 [Butyrivibrio sp.]